MSEHNPRLGGRLQHFLPFWQNICTDSTILRLIKGVEFEFTTKVKQLVLPKPIVILQTEEAFMKTKIQSLLEDGSITEVEHLPTNGWLSNVFLVPKKDGGFCMILNLKPLNKFIKYRKFKMDHIQLVLSLIQPNMVLAFFQL